MPHGDGLFRKGRIWKFRYVGQDGRRHEQSTGTSELRVARAYRQRFLQQLNDRTLPNERAKWPLRDALQDWFERKQYLVRSSTLPPWRTAIRQLCLVLGETLRLDQITSVDIARYQSKRARSVGPKTINNEVQVLIAALKEAKLWQHLQDGYKALRVPKKGPGKALSHDEALRLVKAAHSCDRWFVAFCVVLIAQHTGGRHGETRSLRLGDIQLEGIDPRLIVRRETTKSDAGARQVSLNRVALWALRQLRARAELLGANRPEHYLLPANLSKHTKRSDPLFGRTGYDPQQPQRTWSSAWKKLRTAAGLPNLRFHDLRHTHITWALESGAPIEVVRDQVGHISAHMTRHYTHLSTGAKRRAVDAVEKNHPAVLQLLGLNARAVETKAAQIAAHEAVDTQPEVSQPTATWQLIGCTAGTVPSLSGAISHSNTGVGLTLGT